METLGLAFEWGLMINSGLSSETMETMQEYKKAV